MSKRHRRARCGYDRRSRCQAPNYMVYPYGNMQPNPVADSFYMPQEGAGCPMQGWGGANYMMPPGPEFPPQGAGGGYFPQGPECPSQRCR